MAGTHPFRGHHFLQTQSSARRRMIPRSGFHIIRDCLILVLWCQYKLHKGAANVT
jgi:hypothetical protein